MAAVNQELNPQLPLFGPDRLPHKPYCSNFKAAEKIYPVSIAVGYKYIQPNSPVLVFRIVFDVDYVVTEDAWQLAGLPPPNWVASDPVKRTGHLGYEIEIPVGIGPNHRIKPMRLLAAIEQQYLRALKADTGYAGVVCKNPLHEFWSVLWYRDSPYSLDELAQYVDLTQYNDRRKTSVFEAYGIGRNFVVFEKLRRWAYIHVDEWRAHGNEAGWHQACRDKALSYNQEFASWKVTRRDGKTNAGPLRDREIAAIAQSVSKWCWKWYYGKAESDRRFSALQAARGSKSKKRDALMPRALELAAQGLSARAIAKEIGVSNPTVSAWLKRGVKNP